MSEQFEDFTADFADVIAYLQATGMSDTAFGKAALNDGSFMSALREGRVTLRRLRKARRYMAENPPSIVESSAELTEAPQ